MGALRLVGDFETTVKENDCRVWASCLMDIDSFSTVQLVNNIDDTMYLLKDLSCFEKIELYYHNLKFDGEFILSWLLNNNFRYDEKLDHENTFKTLITDTGAFYQLEIRFHKQKNRKKVVIRDSLKIIPLRVSQMAKAFGLKTTKGDIDYKLNRNINHEITGEEKDYIIRDCRIVAECLKSMFNQGLEKMTIASNALTHYKQLIGGDKKFRGLFPLLSKETDDFIRKSYKGGFTYVNPKYQNKWLNVDGCTYDVNSLYPSQMHSDSENILPYGMPIYFKGEYPQNELYPLYIIRFKCKFKLKKGYVPTVQIKNNSRFAGRETDYLSDSGVERVELTMTNIDFETFKKHYHVTRLEILDGYMFKAKKGLFDVYIDYWAKVKIEAEQQGNKGLRQISKLMMNSLYGKFATNIQNDIKIPVLKDGIVSHESKINIVENIEDYDLDIYEDRERELNYTAIACFITAYARRVTHLAIQENFDTFCYADTDSIHLCCPTAKNIEIHNTKLGAWKHESNWTSAKFIRAKTYIEEINGELDVKCAGMPDNIKSVITKDNFKIGFTTEGLGLEYQKLVPKRVVGGVVLAETTFTIK